MSRIKSTARAAVLIACCAVVLTPLERCEAFALSPSHVKPSTLGRNVVVSARQASSHDSDDCLSPNPPQTRSEQFRLLTTGNHHLMYRRQVTTWTAAVLLSLTGSSPLTPLAARADEYGVEVEAPTLFTGENVMICKKRGPLGACLETERRTEENDNDKAKKYFRDPSELIKAKEAAMRRNDEDEGNALIQKLRLQSEQNREKNDLAVQRKTFENDQSATFGPFDRQVLIMNTDGKTFTLLENPQAMRLKDAGFIKDRQFIKQPTEEELGNALSPPSGEDLFGGIGGALQGLFGGGSNGSE